MGDGEYRFGFIGYVAEIRDLWPERSLMSTSSVCKCRDLKEDERGTHSFQETTHTTTSARALNSIINRFILGVSVCVRACCSTFSSSHLIAFAETDSINMHPHAVGGWAHFKARVVAPLPSLDGRYVNKCTRGLIEMFARNVQCAIKLCKRFTSFSS